MRFSPAIDVATSSTGLAQAVAMFCPSLRAGLPPFTLMSPPTHSTASWSLPSTVTVSTLVVTS